MVVVVSEQYFVIKSVRKAIALLRAFPKGQAELGVSELSERLGFSKTVTQRLVLTLASEGLLRQNPQSRKYALSPRVVEIAGSFLSASPLTQEGRKYVYALVRSTGMTGALGILSGREVLYLVSIEADASVKAASLNGDRSPVHATASGKCLLAFLPEDERNALVAKLDFKALTSKTITNRETFLQELASTALRGYATNQEERVQGLAGVAAPILGSEGRGIAALSVGIPRGLVSDRDIETIADKTVTVAKEMSEKLQGMLCITT